MVAESHPEIQTFYVVVDKDNQEVSKLLGYYTGEVEESILIAYLTEKLPGYMVPTILRRVASFELTINGKIDKEKLPIISLENSKKEEIELTDTEKLLKGVWSEVQMIDEEIISKESSFIKLGGDSI